jgi:hypothetical protein
MKQGVPNLKKKVVIHSNLRISWRTEEGKQFGKRSRKVNTDLDALT